MTKSNEALYRIANAFNYISLASSIVLLISISFEVTRGDRDILSVWYRAVQLAVCSVFFATALFRLITPQYRRKHWLRDTIFALASIPYIDILQWSGISTIQSHQRLIAFIPVLISIMATIVILEWLIEGKRQRLMAAYVLTVTMFTYISALLFYECEIGVNSHLQRFGDALWWAWMNVTTVGAQIFPVTTIGKVVCVLLPIMGMLFFPIFTVYISGYYDKKGAD
jgi:voltage-gated potassium channel